MVGSSPVELGWFDKLKNSLQLNKLAEKLHFSKHKILDMALFFGMGFLIGFLWKRHANYGIACLVFIGVLILLTQLDLIHLDINWTKLQECCGVEPARADVDILSVIWDWSKNNFLLIFSFIIGFCFGAKVS
jgi:hypothetical protein